MLLPIFRHCIVQINETTILSIGGQGKTHLSFDQTMYFNHESQEWTIGPPMKVGRAQHSCGKVIIEDISVIVVAGGVSIDDQDSAFTSVEFLLAHNTTWIEGPELPSPPSLRAQIVSNGHELYLIDTFRLIIRRLVCKSGIQSCQWIKQDNNLQIQRADAIVSLIPDHMTNCSEAS